MIGGPYQFPRFAPCPHNKTVRSRVFLVAHMGRVGHTGAIAIVQTVQTPLRHSWLAKLLRDVCVLKGSHVQSWSLETVFYLILSSLNHLDSFMGRSISLYIDNENKKLSEHNKSTSFVKKTNSLV